MHSYVNHSKTAKKKKKKRYSTISSDFPKQSQLKSAFQPSNALEVTKLTTGWRSEKTNLEWK